MTKHADEEQRRHQVGEALMDVVAERGLAKTTLRQVAEAANVSVGLVQRYFATKEDLLLFGFDHVYRRTAERVAAVPVELPVRNVLTGIAESVLPLTAERQRECRVWLAFVQASINDPDLASAHHRSSSELLDGLRQAIAGAQHTGEIAEFLDSGREAQSLMAFLDGITLNGIATTTTYDPLTQRALLQDHLNRLFAVGRQEKTL